MTKQIWHLFKILFCPYLARRSVLPRSSYSPAASETTRSRVANSGRNYPDIVRHLLRSCRSVGISVERGEYGRFCNKARFLVRARRYKVTFLEFLEDRLFASRPVFPTRRADEAISRDINSNNAR